MFYPSLEQAKQMAAGYDVIPVTMELFADRKTPIEVLRNIRSHSKHCFILESVAGSENWGRYSFLGYQPLTVITAKDGVISSGAGLKQQTTTRDPLGFLRELLAKYKSPRVEGLPPFTGGLVGYFAYDFVQYVIPGLKFSPDASSEFDDFYLMLLDRIIAFDHFRQKIVLIVHASTANLEQSYIEAVAALKEMEQIVLAASLPEEQAPECGEFKATVSESQFYTMVETAKQYIQEGDIFQTVLSNRFSAPCQGDLLHTYRMLRTINPSPYMVYLELAGLEIACASPETLVTLRAGEISSFPLAGTRPLSKGDYSSLAAELLADTKELAEHDMLVDLARNDVGKVSKFGSVKVKNYRNIKRFSHVMHIGSEITGTIRSDCDALATIAAAFPAGTLSGAPKKRACEIIAELEPGRRGPYGGAMGYIDFTGNTDLCIAIRMAVKSQDRVFVQAGAGIVADSVPETEYKEIENKAQAVIEALQAGRRHKL